MGRKRTSVTRLLENDIKSAPEYEQAWLKKARKRPLTTSVKRDKISVEEDSDSKERLLKKGYSTHIHTHPLNRFKSLAVTPSGDDLDIFVDDDRIKTMIIAQTDINGKVQGYTILRKKKDNDKLEHAVKEYKKNEELEAERLSKMSYFEVLYGKNPRVTYKPFSSESDLGSDLKAYTINRELKDESKAYKEGTGRAVLKNLDRFCKKYGIVYRFLPTEGHRYNRANAIFEKKKKSKKTNLERLSMIFIIMSFSLLFVLGSLNLTGYTILSSSSIVTSQYLLFGALSLSIFLLAYFRFKNYIIKKELAIIERLLMEVKDNQS